MYMIPQPYECQECKSKFMWSEHHDPLGMQAPFCLSCYKEYLLKKIPVGVKG